MTSRADRFAERLVAEMEQNNARVTQLSSDVTSGLAYLKVWPVRSGLAPSRVPRRAEAPAVHTRRRGSDRPDDPGGGP